MTALENEPAKRMTPSDETDDCLSNNVRRALENYFADLDGHETSDIYNLFLEQFEKPLFEVVMEVSRGNVTRAAGMLGLNRGTLRNRLKKYGID
ncbi:MAG TPA: DNA-binding transcriptional regulator Fis [Gammaproteobacteria bacterium]|nr:DNA-binding transcriptional regulator Fis [Gammaproteobacteria bacterium]